MSYEFTWLVPGKLLHIYCYGMMNSQEIKSLSEEGDYILLHEGQYPTYVLADSRDVTRLNIRLLDIKYLLHRPSPDSPLGLVLSISNSPLKRFLGSVANKFVRKPVRQFEAVEPALAFICERDPTLPPLAEVEAAWHKWRAAYVPEPSV